MRIVAVSNIKGGVGKTTTAVSLSYLCSAGGSRTVLWDLDSQGAATYMLGLEGGDGVSAKKLVSGRRELAELVVHSAHERLDVIPSDFSYRKFDAHLAARKNPTERLLRMSRPLAEEYDTLFLDCPPGISLLSESVLRAADAVIVPLLPTPLSVRMLVELRDFITAAGWTDMVFLPFFSMVDHRKSLHAEVIADVRRQFPLLLRTEVPYASEIERMALRRLPINAHAPASMPAQVYAALWKEVAGRLRRAGRAA